MFPFNRYEDTGDAFTRHASHAGQRAAAVFLRLLHIWYRRRPIVGGYLASTMLPEGSTQRQISWVSQQWCTWRHTFLPHHFTVRFSTSVRPSCLFIITLHLHRFCIFFVSFPWSSFYSLHNCRVNVNLYTPHRVGINIDRNSISRRWRNTRDWMSINLSRERACLRVWNLPKGNNFSILYISNYLIAVNGIFKHFR